MYNTLDTGTPLLDLDDRIEKSKKLRIVCMAVVNFGHMFPLLRIADALVERGHEVHIVSCGNKQGKEKIPMLYKGMDVKIHLPESPEQETMYEPMKDRKDAKNTFIMAWKDNAFKTLDEI